MTAEEEQEVERAWRLAFDEWKPAPPPEPPPPPSAPKLKSKLQGLLPLWVLILSCMGFFVLDWATHKPTQEENGATLIEAMAGHECDKLPTTMGVLFCRWDTHKLTHLQKP